MLRRPRMLSGPSPLEGEGTNVVGGVRRRSFLTLLAAVAAVPAASGPARAEYVYAPDIALYCEPTLRPLLAELAAAWRRESGVPVHILTSPTPLMLEQIGHRARADLVIGAGAAAEAAAAEREIIKPETRVTLWRNRLVVAARGAASGGATGDPAQRVGSGPIAIVDPLPGSAGEASRQALAALGLWPALEKNAMGVASTQDASFLLAQQKVERAVLYASDVAARPGFAVAAELPDAAYPPIVYWLAETSNMISTRAGDFAAFLRQPAAQQAARAAGLEVLP